MSLQDVQSVFERLRASDLVHFVAEVFITKGHEIQGVYPFSSVPTKHLVTFLNWPEAKPVYAMCAVDALGIPFMFHKDVEISSSCPHCGRPIVVVVQDGRVVSRVPAELVVWVGNDRTECAATSVCPTINFFCSPAHLEAWGNTDSRDSGFVLNLGEALFVGRGLFGDLLSSHIGQMGYSDTGTGARFSPKATTTMTSSGGLLAAFLASLCCVGPLVLAALGVGVGASGFLASTAGALKALLPYRPVFIGLTGLLLGVAFYQAYRKPQSACVPGATCVPAPSQRTSRVVLWAVAALALALILAPYWLGL